MTFNRVEQWPEEAYQQQLDLQSDGQMAVTHTALMKPPVGAPCRAYVKHYSGPETARALFNEWFVYHLMSALGVPQPRAAVMRAPRWSTYELAWAFVSCEPSPVHYGTPKQRYNYAVLDHRNALAARLLGCPFMPHLLAADQLAANSDRNMGNLVFTGKETFVAIDHGNALHGPAWTPTQMWSTQRPYVPKPLVVFYESSLRGVPSDFANAMVMAADLTEEAYYARQDELRAVLDCKHDATTCMVMDMTWWRCIELGKWTRAMLGVM